MFAKYGDTQLGNRRLTDSFASVGRRVTNAPQVANLPHKESHV
jgi:hypothetical protein